MENTEPDLNAKTESTVRHVETGFVSFFRADSGSSSSNFCYSTLNFNMGITKRKMYADASSEKVKEKKFTQEINEQKAF
jgi:hypothetical protein